jgi:hypothetical protein
MWATKEKKTQKFPKRMAWMALYQENNIRKMGGKDWGRRVDVRRGASEW